MTQDLVEDRVLKTPPFNELRTMLGDFSITNSLIRESPQLVMKIMARCIIQDTGKTDKGINYRAYSPYFQHRDEGDLVPSYFWSVTDNKFTAQKGGQVTWHKH